MDKVINLFKLILPGTKKRSRRSTYLKNKKPKKDTIPARSPRERELNLTFYGLK